MNSWAWVSGVGWQGRHPFSSLPSAASLCALISTSPPPPQHTGYLFKAVRFATFLSRGGTSPIVNPLANLLSAPKSLIGMVCVGLWECKHWLVAV